MSYYWFIEYDVLSTEEYQYWPRWQPRSILAFASGYHIIFNDSIINNNCFIIYKHFLLNYNQSIKFLSPDDLLLDTYIQWEKPQDSEHQEYSLGWLQLSANEKQSIFSIKYIFPCCWSNNGTMMCILTSLYLILYRWTSPLQQPDENTVSERCYRKFTISNWIYSKFSNRQA